LNNWRSIMHTRSRDLSHEKIILLEFEQLAIFQLYSLMSNVSLRWSISQSVSLNEASLAMVSIADSILN
jgi:hypothetical protein